MTSPAERHALAASEPWQTSPCGCWVRSPECRHHDTGLTVRRDVTAEPVEQVPGQTAFDLEMT